ncbi:DUF302 domain-containing protein [Thiohalorhabdus methylotrophus]|uniref:DUF302 domain-containing protein n=1 Tax=Thiohalorhabdus methylotrophus TaxID=3242694 RepID=A0ABV4TV10_9GAMM
MLLFCMILLPDPVTAGSEVYQAYAPDKTYRGVMLDLRLAISERNFALVGRNTIGRAIDRQRQEDFPRATVLQICNLDLGRAALRADPGLLPYLPCRIAVYEEPKGGIRLSTQLLPHAPGAERRNEIADRINDHLRAIVDFGAKPLPDTEAP